LAQRNSLPSGHDPDYQAFIEEQRKARRLLARIDGNEDFAREWEQFSQFYPYLAGQELEHGRQRFANTYRKVVGVLPDQRASLRNELQEIVRTGNGTVEAAIAAARNGTARTVSEKDSNDPFA
jgi:hypothetical protein